MHRIKQSLFAMQDGGILLGCLVGSSLHRFQIKTNGVNKMRMWIRVEIWIEQEANAATLNSGNIPLEALWQGRLRSFYDSS